MDKYLQLQALEYQLQEQMRLENGWKEHKNTLNYPCFSKWNQTKEK